MQTYLTLISEVGFPIANVFIRRVFYFSYRKIYFRKRRRSGDGIHNIVTALDNRVKTMNHDMIRVDATMCFRIRY